VAVAVGRVAMAVAASELDGEALAHKHRSMKGWDDIPGVHGVLILNEAEAVHNLDLCDLAGAMLGEMSLDVGLGRMFGQVAQVKASRRDLRRHGYRSRYPGPDRRKKVKRSGQMKNHPRDG